jgi:hypothetical protein
MTTTTTTTTAIPKLCPDCLEGITIEVMYIQDNSDLTKLGAGYIKPTCYNVGGHGCNRALFGVLLNGTFAGFGKLNNNNGIGGGNYNGANICEDYKNVHPNWLATSNSRYSKTIISKTLAQTIVNNTPAGQNFIRIKMEAAMQAISPIATCDGTAQPHSETAWFRITSKNGDIIFNGCLSTANSQVDIYTCGICLNIQHRTRISPPAYDIRKASGFVMGLYNNKPYYKITDDVNNYKVLGYVLWKNNQWEFHEKFSSITGNTSGKLYGVNNSPLSPLHPIQAGIWTVNTQTSAINEKKILGGSFGCICDAQDEKDKCNCEGLSYKKGLKLIGRDKFYEVYLPKLKKIKDERC